MRAGGGKSKGSAFERQVCKDLSLWLSNGKRTDVLWRSAMSGGRATVSHGKVRQCGDICAVAPEGHKFCDLWFVECKFVKRLALDQFIMKGTGPLMSFWRKATQQADKHRKSAMLIARQNGWPTIIITREALLRSLTTPVAGGYSHALGMSWEVYKFDELLKAKCPY